MEIKIIMEFQNKSIEFSEDEALQVYRKLHEFFGEHYQYTWDLIPRYDYIYRMYDECTSTDDFTLNTEMGTCGGVRKRDGSGTGKGRENGYNRRS